MQINIPDVLAEVTAAFARYEKALVTNDTLTLDELFRTADETVRFGIAENLFGIEEIRKFRNNRPAINLAREVAAHQHHDLRPRLRHHRDHVRSRPRRPARPGGRCSPGPAFRKAGASSPPTSA